MSVPEQDLSTKPASDVGYEKKAIAAVRAITLPLICMLLFGSLSVFFGIDSNWDLLNYHYYNVYAWFHGRVGFDLLPAFMQSCINPTLDIPFYLLTQTFTPRVGGFILGAIHGLNVWLLVILARQLLFPHESNWWSRLILLTCCICAVLMPAFVLELGTTYNDNLISPLTLVSLYILLKELTSKHETVPVRTMILAGLLAGASVGIKLTSAPFAAGLLMMTLWCGPTLHRRIVSFFLFGVSALITMLACMAPWSLLMWKHFQSPLFPYFNNIFKSDMTMHHSFADPRWMNYEGLFEFILYPFRWSLNTKLVTEQIASAPMFFVVYTLLFLVLAIYAVRRIRPQWQPAGMLTGMSVPTAAFITFYVVSLALWQKMLIYYRYLFVLELLSPVLLLLLLRMLIRRRRVSDIVGALACLGIIWWTPQQIPSKPAVWPETFFEVQPPELPDPANTLILLPDHRAPLAFMIPSFDPRIRFVRVAGLLSEPGLDVGVQQVARDIIEKHDGPIYAMHRYLTHEGLPALLTLLEERISHYQLEIANPIPLKAKSRVVMAKVVQLRKAEPAPSFINIPAGPEACFVCLDRRIAARLGTVTLNDRNVDWVPIGGWSLAQLPDVDGKRGGSIQMKFEPDKSLPASAIRPLVLDWDDPFLYFAHDIKRNHTSHGLFYLGVQHESPFLWTDAGLEIPIPWRERDDSFTVLRIRARHLPDDEAASRATRENNVWMLDDGKGQQQRPLSSGAFLYPILQIPDRTEDYASIDTVTLYPPTGHNGIASMVETKLAKRRITVQPDPSWREVVIKGKLIVSDTTAKKRACQIVINGIAKPTRDLRLDFNDPMNRMEVVVPLDGSGSPVTLEIQGAGVLGMTIEPGPASSSDTPRLGENVLL